MPKPKPTPPIHANVFIARLRARPRLSEAQELGFVSPSGRAIRVAKPVHLRGRVFDYPVRIVGVEFLDHVDLSESHFQHALRIEGCTFRKGLRLTDVQVQSICSLRGSRFTDPERRWLDWRRLRVGGLFDLITVTSSVGIDLTNLIAGDDVRLDGLRCQSALPRKEMIDGLQAIPEVDKHHLREEMVGKALNLEGAEIRRHLYAYEHGRRHVRLRGSFDLRGRVGGQVMFLGAHLYGGNGTSALDLSTAVVGGSVFFWNGTSIHGLVDLRGKVAGNVEFMSALVNAGQAEQAVDLESAEIGGSVFFRDSTHVIGQIDLRAKVQGQVVLSGSLLDAGTQDWALRMDASDFGGPVFLDGGTRIVGGVNLYQAQLRAGLFASARAVETQFGPPQVDQQTVQLRTIGDWQISFATITGSLQLHGVNIYGRMTARHLVVHGDLDLCECIVGPGEVSDELKKKLIAPPADEDLPWLPEDFSRSVQASEDPTLDLELAKVHGRLWVKCTRALGEVNLEDAEIDGDANFDQSVVDGNLVLRSAVVKGRVFNEDGGTGPYPQVTGHVDLAHAQVQRVDIRFQSEQQATTPRYVDLRDATVESLRFHGQINEEGRPWLVTEGTVFMSIDAEQLEIGVDEVRTTWNARIRVTLWVLSVIAALVLAVEHGSLALTLVASLYAVGTLIVYVGNQWFRLPRNRGLLRLLKRTYPFSPGFYLHVEKWLRAQGDDIRADEVFVLRRRLQSRSPGKVPEVFTGSGVHGAQQPPRLGTDLWLRLVDFATGYGVRVERLLHLTYLLWLINTGVFLSPSSVERPLTFVQHRTDGPSWGNAEKDPEKVRHLPNPWPDEGGMPNPDGSEWGITNAFFMAMRVQIPILNLVAENDWEPSSRPFLGCFTYEEYASVMMVINLILIPLLIAGLTGYLKKE